MLSNIDERNKNLIVTCAFLLIVLLALILRLKDIASFPFDFDEGIHGFYSYQLYKTGEWIYAPSYHGPFLYYITACIFALLGDSIVTARLMPAFFSVAMILLIYPMRKHFGNIGFLVTSALFAFSPLFIMYSQVLRNDVFLTFFTLATVVCILLYLEQKKDIYLVLGAASLALTFTVKETAYITLFVFGSFLVLYYLYKILTSKYKIETTKDILAEFSQKIKTNPSAVIICMTVFLLIYTTPFFMYPNGFLRGWSESFHFWFYAAYLYSFDPSATQPLFQPFNTYFKVLIAHELPVLIFATLGGIYYSFIEKNKFMQFVSYWALASLAIYSFIPYKTPWLSLHMLLPLILLAGAFLGKSFEFLLSETTAPAKKHINGGRHEKEKVKGGHILVVSITILLIACFYVYSLGNISHAGDVGYDELGEYVKEVTDMNFETKVFIIVPPGRTMYDVHWPLPWYIREYDWRWMESDDLSSIYVGAYVYKAIYISPKWAAEDLDTVLQELGYVKKSFDSVGLIVYSP